MIPFDRRQNHPVGAMVSIQSPAPFDGEACCPATGRTGTVTKDNSIDLRGRTILIVDDISANLAIAVNYLEDNNFNVVVAQDGKEGLGRAQLVKPDLILLDVMMAGLDGFQTCSQLKSIESTRDIPVIFMTALTDTSDKVKAFEAGAVDYVNKPFQG